MIFTNPFELGEIASDRDDWFEDVTFAEKKFKICFKKKANNDFFGQFFLDKKIFFCGKMILSGKKSKKNCSKKSYIFHNEFRIQTVTTVISSDGLKFSISKKFLLLLKFHRKIKKKNFLWTSDYFPFLNLNVYLYILCSSRYVIKLHN